MPTMVNLLLIGTGGFFGAVSRYGVSQIFPATKLHLGTLAVNLVGCLLIGITFGFLEREAITRPAQLLLVTGFYIRDFFAIIRTAFAEDRLLTFGG